jgi:hypothetical protein
VPSHPEDTATPLWQWLASFSPADKQNAQIQLEFASHHSASLLTEAQRIEATWNNGGFDQAIGQLRSLEETVPEAGLAVGIAWRVPRVLTNDKWITDKRVGLREGLYAPSLDFDESTNNLFVALKIDDGSNNRWSVNFSSDWGNTWSETFAWGGTAEVGDVCGRVGDGYFFVAYVFSLNPTETRIRRFSLNDGTVDNAFGWKLVFDHGVGIRDISVETNTDNYDNRIYCMAILDDGTLPWYYTTNQGDTWNSITLPVNDASNYLDVHWNKDSTDHWMYLAYLSTGGRVKVVAYETGNPTVIDLDDAVGRVSIAAYEDRVLVVYSYEFADGYGVRYRVSYDDGANWYVGNIAVPVDNYYWAPNVAARRNGGFACVYQEEVGEPDICWYRRREYGTGPGTAGWTPPEQFNEQDVVTGREMNAEYIPPFPNWHFAHGVVWISGVGIAAAYFDAHDNGRYGDATIATNSQVSVYTIPDRSGDPLNNCYLYGGARTDATITLEVTDESGNPISGVPAEDMWMETTLGGLHLCTNGSIADDATNAAGLTTFSQAVAGGYHTDPNNGERTRIYINGHVTPQQFNVQFNSPDIDGNLVVNLSDVPPFAQDYFNPYNYRSDFHWNGVINLADVALLANGIGATCPPAKLATETEGTESGTIAVYFDPAATCNAVHREPFTTFNAYLCIDGPVTVEGIYGWQCQLEMSDNLVVDGWSYPDQCLNILNPPDFVVGVGTKEPLPVQDEAVLLLTMAMHVTDRQPAYVYINSGGQNAAPMCVAGSDLELRALARPNGAGATKPVASINGPDMQVAEDTPDAGPLRLALDNTPNPFNPVTEIGFALPLASFVRLEVYDVTGRLVATLIEDHYEAGRYSHTWDGRDAARQEVGSGVYFGRLATNQGSVISKMILIR